VRLWASPARKPLRVPPRGKQVPRDKRVLRDKRVPRGKRRAPKLPGKLARRIGPGRMISRWRKRSSEIKNVRYLSMSATTVASRIS